MSQEYFYPQVTGYRWNMMQRLQKAIGREFWSSGDILVEGEWKTCLRYDPPLSIEEKAAVDLIMADDPCYPPKQFGVRFRIDDLYERLAQFRQTTGIQFDLYFNESVTGSGVVDLLELHAPAPLTNNQKNQVRNAFAALIREA